MDLGAIYHSHVRSAPYPSQTDINFAAGWPGVEWIIVGLAGADARGPLVPDRGGDGAREQTPAGRAMSEGVRCCGAPDAAGCTARTSVSVNGCALPLVSQETPPPLSENARRARLIKPQYAEGDLVRVARASSQPEAEMIEQLLLDQGIPSLVRRAPGMDVPDFLAAGARDFSCRAPAPRRRAKRSRRPAAPRPVRPGRPGP